MRKSLLAAAVVFSTTASHADPPHKKKKTPPAAAPAEPPAAAAAAPARDDERLDVVKPAPPTGEKQEHAAEGPTRPADDVPAVDEDVARELATKQMRRYEKPIRACTDAARKRGHSGELMLQLAVAERHVTPSVTSDTTGDPKLRECLLQAARGWQLPAQKLTLPWTVTVEK